MLFYRVDVFAVWETDMENAHVCDKGYVCQFLIGVNKDNRWNLHLIRKDMSRLVMS